jgi:hypothetical protein
MLPVYVVALTVFAIGCLAAVEGLPVGAGLAPEGMALTLSSLGPSVSGALRRRRGRPRKFAAPSRAVTLTLPESVIASLARIDRDISRAIVGLATRRAHKNGHAAAELSVFGRRAVITVQPRESLAARTDIELVPLPDGRALISFDQPRSIADLELRLNDALDDKALTDEDRQLFEGVMAILRDARRSDDVTVLQRSIIVLESSKRPAKALAGSGRAKARA